MSRAVLLEVKLPPGVNPTADTNEMLIRKFLKECSKESLVQYLYEECAYTRRFVKKSVKERLLRSKYKRNAKNYNLEINSETEKEPKKRKKSRNSQ